MSILSRGVIFSLTIGFFLLAGPLMALNAPFNPSPFPDGEPTFPIQFNDSPNTIQDSICSRNPALNPLSIPLGLNIDSVQNLAKPQDHTDTRFDLVSGFALIGTIL